MPDPSPMLTVEDVAKRLSVCTKSIHLWVAAGEFPAPVRVQRRTFRWYEHEIVEYLNSRPRAVAGDK